MAVSNAEQLIIELINRARLDPLAEAQRQNIDLNQDLEPGTIKAQPLEPLAWNDRLALAADGHSDWMLRTNTFSHTGQYGSTLVERSDDAGYLRTGLWSLRENLSRIGVRPDPIDMTKAAPAHHVNLYTSESHRVNIFAGDIREVGLGQVKGVYSTNADFNTSMLTQMFGRTGTDFFVTGVVLDDADRDDFYDIGEGRSGYTITAGSRSDTTRGSGGYEVAVAPSGSLQVTVSKSGSALAKVLLDMSDGNAKLDLIRGGRDELALSTSAKLVSGVSAAQLLGAANLDLEGNGAGNKLTGNRGNNTLEGAGGNDAIDGGAGTDTAVLRIDRIDASVSNSNGVVTISSSLGTDTYRNIEFFQFADGKLSVAQLGGGSTSTSGTSASGQRIEGTGGNDRLAGTDGRDGILGRGGNDTILGGAGDDVLKGNSGKDYIRGQADHDTLYGGKGIDNLGGGGGNDRLYGGGGSDRVLGGSGKDKLYGGSGNDILKGHSGKDVIRGQAGNDILYGNIGADNLGGGGGDDRLYGGGGSDRGFGGSGNDRIFGGSGGDVLKGNSGRDVVRGQAGDDALYGGGGRDNLRGGGGDDRLFGGGGGDRLSGGSGNDVLNGGNGDDFLAGHRGRDTFVFNNLRSGERDTVLDYQDGIDQIRISGVSGTDAVGKFGSLQVASVGDGAQISYKGHVIVLDDVRSVDLDSGDFIFS